MIISTYVTCGITTAVVLGRVLFRARGTTLGMGWDDWCIIAAQVCAIILTVIGVHGMVGHGLERDLWTLPFDEITELLKYFYLAEILYILTMPCLKMSILFFYMRIFTTPMATKIPWTSQLFNALFTLSYILVTIFQCHPIDYFWNNWDGTNQGVCLNFHAVVWTIAVVGIAMDLWMLAIPLNTLRWLNLEWKNKVGVGLMFFVGTLHVQIFSSFVWKLVSLVINRRFSYFAALPSLAFSACSI